MPMVKKTEKPRQIMKAVASIAVTVVRIAPGLAVIQVLGSVITAALPITTTYFAALTTTALAEAYAGSEAAGQMVLWYVGITAALGVLMTAWQTAQSYFNQLMDYRIDAAISDQMYDKLHRIEFWRYDDKETADQFDRAKQFTNLFPIIFQQLADVLTGIITMLIAVWALALINIWLALILFLAVVPSAYVQFQLSRLSAEHWRKNVETRRRLGRIEWSIFRPEMMAELRLYNVIKHLLKLRQELRDKDQKARIDYERKFMLKRFGADVIVAAAEVASLVWVALEIIGRRQPIGQFLFVQQIVSRALSGINRVVGIVNDMDEHFANMADYYSFMELPDSAESKDALPVLANSIKVDKVTFKYPGSDTLVLDNISLEIKQGQFVALVGENGAGKTTLLKLMTGLYSPTSGSITVDGRNLDSIDSASWHRQLAVLGQDFIRYNFATANENVWYGDVNKGYDPDKIDSALKAAEAADFVKKLPKGGDSYVDKWMESTDGVKGTDLSGGQWQRLALARNFYRDSPIIILDEPTSAIDALAEAKIFRRLLKETDKTIITVSHRLTTVEKADIIYMLENGRVVEQGTHQELVKKRGAYYRMFEDQIN